MNAGQNERMLELERQNEELRRVIRHMRRDIETLGNQEPSASVALPDQPPTAKDPGADNGMDRSCFSFKTLSVYYWLSKRIFFGCT